MGFCSNELWVMQEISQFSIQLESRDRKGKLIFVYDFVSRFILYTQFYFLSDTPCNHVDIFDILWKYGIPNCIILPGYECRNKFTDEFVNILGIEFIERKEGQKGKSGLECLCIDWKGVEDIEQEWKDSLSLLRERIYHDFDEFQCQLEQAVMKWNYGVHIGLTYHSPAERFQQDIRHHIFLEKQTLSECYVMRYTGNVEDGGSYGTVQVLHRIYQVPVQFVGETLTFYISVMQKDEIFIYDQDRNRLLYRCPFMKQIDNSVL